MKTSLDLPDELYRRVKSKSALQGRGVREVATALLSAWVDGRVPAVDSGVAAETEESNPRQQWLARWRELATDVTQALGGSEGLLDHLHRDRG